MEAKLFVLKFKSILEGGDKMKKGIATCVLMGLVVLSALTVPVSAQPTADSFGVNDARGDPGAVVSVPVTITNAQNGPILSMIFDITYDPSAITIDNVQRGDLTSTWDSPSFNNFAWGTRVSAVYDGNETNALQNGASGSVVILHFNVANRPGSTSDLGLSNIQLSDTAYNVGTASPKDGKFTITGVQASQTSTAGATATPSVSTNVSSLSPVPTVGVGATPTVGVGATPTRSPDTSSGAAPTPEEPGFGAVFAIAGLLAIAYVLLRRK
jgi:PGF-CTERM protein